MRNFNLTKKEEQGMRAISAIERNIPRIAGRHALGNWEVEKLMTAMARQQTGTHPNTLDVRAAKEDIQNMVERLLKTSGLTLPEISDLMVMVCY